MPVCQISAGFGVMRSHMLQVSYSIKCWLLSFSFYMMFYFIVFAKGYASIELLYLLGVSTLLFPISKRIIDALCDTLIPNTALFHGLLLPFIINSLIWLLTPFIIALTLVVYTVCAISKSINPISHPKDQRLQQKIKRRSKRR